MSTAHVQTESRIADLPGQVLARTVADLQTTRPAPGLWRYFSSMTLVFVAAALAYQQDLGSGAFYFAALLAGIFFAAAAVTTHDAIHHTLTGIGWFDEISARVASWGALWPHGVYSELHKLHHKMNGVDERDPERVTYTHHEYEQAGQFKRFMIRNQLFIAVFVSGGLGMILAHLCQAVGFMKQSKGLRQQLIIDALGIVAVNGTLYTLAAAHGQLAKAVVLFFIIERVGGGLLQFRAHIEHYGIVGKRTNHFSTQLHACRNIETHPAMSWLFNGLNFHSIHHAFPKVPFYHLQEAHNRVTRLLDREKAEPMPQSKGYIKTFLELTREVKLIAYNQNR